MEVERELTLLSLLEWEEQQERWLSVLEADRMVVVQELARLMVRMAEAEASDE